MRPPPFASCIHARLPLPPTLAHRALHKGHLPPCRSPSSPHLVRGRAPSDAVATTPTLFFNARRKRIEVEQMLASFQEGRAK